jgi:anti-sigma-K factor RskA
MTEHAWYRAHLVEYAAGVLDARDAEMVHAHLAQCKECQAAVAAAAHDLRYLALGTAPVPPSPGFRDRTLRAALGRETGQPRRTPVWTWLLAASTILAVGMAFQARQTSARLSGELAARDAEVDSLASALTMARDTLGLLGPASTVRYAALTMQDASGGLLVFEDQVTHRWHLVAHGLPRLPDGQRYQLWYLCEDGMAEGTMLTMSPDGVARVTVGMPENPPGRVVGAAITVETIGGGTPPEGHGPKVATLML